MTLYFVSEADILTDGLFVGDSYTALEDRIRT